MKCLRLMTERVSTDYTNSGALGSDWRQPQTERTDPEHRTRAPSQGRTATARQYLLPSRGRRQVTIPRWLETSGPSLRSAGEHYSAPSATGTGGDRAKGGVWREPDGHDLALAGREAVGRGRNDREVRR